MHVMLIFYTNLYLKLYSRMGQVNFAQYSAVFAHSFLKYFVSFVTKIFVVNFTRMVEL